MTGPLRVFVVLAVIAIGLLIVVAVQHAILLEQIGGR